MSSNKIRLDKIQVTAPPLEDDVISNLVEVSSGIDLSSSMSNNDNTTEFNVVVVKNDNSLEDFSDIHKKGNSPMSGMYVYIYVCMYCIVCMYACIYVSMYVYMYICMYVCMYIYMYIYI